MQAPKTRVLRRLFVVSLLILGLFIFAARSSFRDVNRSLADSWKVPTQGVAIWDVGPLPPVVMQVENTVHYQLNSTLSTDFEWDALSPNGGVVYLGPDADPFLPSVFHQLRCLNVIRLAYVEVDRESLRARHCLNYLRQMLLCRSDLNLESVVTVDGPHAVSQRRSQTCQDWRVVYEELRRNQVYHFAHSAEKPPKIRFDCSSCSEYNV